MSIEQFDSLDAEKLSNGKYVWVWTSPGGACHQGAKHYTRRESALRAGREFLVTLMQARPQPGPQQ